LYVSCVACVVSKGMCHIVLEIEECSHTHAVMRRIMTSLFSRDKEPKLRLVYIYSIDKNPSCASCLLSLRISQTEVGPVPYIGTTHMYSLSW
jgi:hypothetical protein